MEVLIVLAVVAVVPLIYVIATYNTLVALRNHIRDAWADIDTEFKRRYDLIPNLVATVKGYAAHEKEVLDRVTQLRTQCATQWTIPWPVLSSEQRRVLCQTQSRLRREAALLSQHHARVWKLAEGRNQSAAFSGRSVRCPL